MSLKEEGRRSSRDNYTFKEVACGAGRGKDVKGYQGHNWELIADLDEDQHGVSYHLDNSRQINKYCAMHEMFRREDRLADEEDNLWIDSLFH